MANTNKIKYVSGNEILNGALTNNYVALGVDMDLDYGPTTDTGYWQGITPNNSGYTIYSLNGIDQPRIEVAKDDNALVFFANSFGAPSVSTAAEAISWFKSQGGYFIVNRKFDSITTSGMTLMYDPGLVQSYPKSGTTMDNLGSLANGANTPQMTLDNVSFVNEKGGVLSYVPNDNAYCYTSESTYLNDFTYNVWFKISSIDGPWTNILTRNNDYHQIGFFANDETGGFIDFYDDYSGTDVYDESGSPQLVPGKWYNVTVRHIEGETTQLYLDNVLIGEDTNNTSLYNENFTDFYIGGLGGGSFDGQIGHIAVYNRALSVVEIEKNYNALHNRYYGALEGETMMFLSKMPTNDNFGYVILDPSTGTANGPFDTGISSVDYSENNFDPLSWSGYGLEFNGNDKKVLFIDSFGTIVEEITFNTGNLDRDNAEGKVIVYNDSNNGIMKFFDGLTVGTYTYDTNNEQAYFDWNWDGAARDKTFVIYTRDTNTNVITWKLANAQTGVVSIDSYNNNDYSAEPILYYSGDFAIVVLYNNNTSQYDTFKVYKTDGTLIRNEDISTFGFTSWNAEMYGINKCSFIFWNGNDSDVDYHMYAYNGETNTFVTGTHPKGSIYNWHNTYTTNLDWAGRSYISEKITYQFYSNYNWNNWYADFDYMSFVTLFDGASSFTTYDFANGTTKKIAWDGDGIYYTDLVDTGDGKLKTMMLLPSGATFTELVADITTVTSVSQYTYGGYYFVQVIINNVNTEPTFYAFNGTTGELLDTLTFIANSDWDWSTDNAFDSFLITDYNNGRCWYFHNGSTSFTLLNSAYDYRWNPNTRYRGIEAADFGDIPYLTLFNPNGNLAARILSPTGMSNEFTLPAHGGNWNLYRNISHIAWYYRNQDTNLPSVRLIDLSGNTVSDYSGPVADNNWNFWNHEAVGNIAMAIAGEGYTNGTLEVTIINPDNTSDQKTLSYQNLGNYWYNFNDYFWWD